MIRLTFEPFDPGALLTEFCRGRSEVGAVATFTGIARAEAGSTVILELEAYPGFTEAEIGKFAGSAKVRFGLDDLMIRHRVGKIPPGDAVVFVATARNAPPIGFRSLRLPDGLFEVQGALLEEGTRPRRRPVGGAEAPGPRRPRPLGKGDTPMNAPVLSPGGRIDESLQVKPVRIAILTISDTRDEESDTSGHVLAERVKAAGHELADRAIVRDSIVDIRERRSKAGWRPASSRRSSPRAAPASPAAT